MKNLYECALCWIMLTDEDTEDTAIMEAAAQNPVTRRTCKDRDACNVRRMERIYRQAGRASLLPS